MRQLLMAAALASLPLGSASLWPVASMRYRGGPPPKNGRTFKMNARREAKRLRRRVSRRV